MTTLIQRLRRFGAAALLLAGAVSASHAATIDFLFNGHGSFAVDGDQVSVLGVANDWAGLVSPIPGTWEVLSSFVSTGGNTASGSWIFADVPSGANSLLGSATATGFMTTLPDVVKVDIAYTVEGGTGIFSSGIGTGVSTIYANLKTGNYTEAGAFSVTAVPEPSTVLLLAGGLLAVGALRRRRMN